ncbi:scarecrow-like protein 28 [Coffea eugenioides]|uniref:Scarecrow-like protein 28 n=1 Tax=Coffea arabica TaxID=13443 RepID=A0A6P6TPP4_COFAR|nr:scarecrow-like protein 28 [Coffea arabica]XP_027083311.1 scarecrow-like protein 28 [Coffea arabica]XP_027180274.1 scarecrow-like protein 28 [Coffea eugenioides]
MLAGCSSTLLSPRHRLRSEAPAQFQACHFPSMSTQRLDLPCSFTRKDTPRNQTIRPVGLSVDKPIEAKTSSCSLKQNIRLPPSATTAQTGAYIEGSRKENRNEFWEKNKSLKRYAEQGPFAGDDDESCMIRAKRKRGNGKSQDFPEEEKKLTLGQLGSGSFWLQQPPFDVPRSVPLIAGLSSPQIPLSLSYSGDEDRVCFVPSDVISPPLPLSNNPWVESVVTQITDLGDKNVETGQGPAKEASASSTSSESQGLVLRLNENPTEHEIGNGSKRPNTSEIAEVVAGQNDDDNHREHDGFELVSLLVACADAIASKNILAINHFIARLGELASPRGSPISRLTAYFTEALSLRVARFWPHIFHISPPRDLDRVDDDCGTSLRLLNQVSPIPRFIHFTSNEILLRAFEGKDRVHIIDFDIKQGLQWPSLFQSLASRTNPPSHIRITGIGESKQELIETGDRLAGFAEALNLPFEFHPVVDRLEDVRLWMLHVKEKESVAVNCIFQLHKMLYDSTGGVLRDFLGLIRSTNPTVVLMGEQEAEHNGPGFETRLTNSLKYYSAIFDSLEENIAADSPIRMKIEEMFAREIRNIIACEGQERFERHQGFVKWQKMMEQGGFRSLNTGERELLQSRMLLKMYGSENYKVEKQGEDGAALTLSWLDQPLYTISAWWSIDVAGSSSSFSQRVD